MAPSTTPGDGEWSTVTTRSSTKGKHPAGDGQEPANDKDPPPVGPAGLGPRTPTIENTPQARLDNQVTMFIDAEQELQTFGKELWEDYKDEFNGWTQEMWDSISKITGRKLKRLLHYNGIYMPPSASFMELCELDTMPQYPPKELKYYRTFRGGKY